MFFPKRPKKSLGQNFLTDNNIINKILKIGNINQNKTVLEIGPGYGSITNAILSKNPKKIYIVEKDKDIFQYLKSNINYLNKIKIINEDFLKINENKIIDQNVIVYGNLPYNISTQILAKLIQVKKWPPWYETLIFMFQEEVADRIIGEKNSSSFGRLSVLCNWRLDIKKHFNVSASCFSPKPRVNSTVLSFKPKKNKYNIKNPKNLEKITRILFSNRRKMINKNFLKLFKNNSSVAKDLNLDLNKRPEELSNEMFYKITMKYEDLFR